MQHDFLFMCLFVYLGLISERKASQGLHIIYFLCSLGLVCPTLTLRSILPFKLGLCMYMYCKYVWIEAGSEAEEREQKQEHS